MAVVRKGETLRRKDEVWRFGSSSQKKGRSSRKYLDQTLFSVQGWREGRRWRRTVRGGVPGRPQKAALGGPGRDLGLHQSKIDRDLT